MREMKKNDESISSQYFRNFIADYPKTICGDN